MKVEMNIEVALGTLEEITMCVAMDSMKVGTAFDVVTQLCCDLLEVCPVELEDDLVALIEVLDSLHKTAKNLYAVAQHLEDMLEGVE